MGSGEETPSFECKPCRFRRAALLTRRACKSPQMHLDAVNAAGRQVGVHALVQGRRVGGQHHARRHLRDRRQGVWVGWRSGSSACATLPTI